MIQSQIGKFKILGELIGEPEVLSLSLLVTHAISAETEDITAPLLDLHPLFTKINFISSLNH